ncbi:hypothetical protein BJ165DRAFT_414884 [Panaeolus papilionaceus]|nr:hypothetical protein BJ165DRAFT_414884 [Panaeolus papilionaceus]
MCIRPALIVFPSSPSVASPLITPCSTLEVVPRPLTSSTLPISILTRISLNFSLSAHSHVPRKSETACFNICPHSSHASLDLKLCYAPTKKITLFIPSSCELVVTLNWSSLLVRSTGRHAGEDHLTMVIMICEQFNVNRSRNPFTGVIKPSAPQG